MDEGIAELQKAVKLRPEFAPLHAALAQAYREKRDFADAAAEMQRVIALNPQNENAYNQLGFVYLQANKPTKAEAIFGQLLRIDPKSADGHNGLADAFAEQRRYQEALEEYKRVAALDSSHQGVNYNLGVMQDRLNMYDDAIASLLKQRQIADDSDNENLLAEVYEAKGMKSEAAAARQTAKESQASQ